MRDVGSDEDDRLAEHADGSNARHENVVHAAEFHVDFQAQIRESLRCRLVHVLRLNALRSQTDQCVADALHFGVDRCLARKHDHDQLQAGVVALEEPKHRLDLFDARGVFAKTRLTNDRHASIVGYALQLLRERPRERRMNRRGHAFVRLTEVKLRCSFVVEQSRRWPMSVFRCPYEIACRACPRRLD